MQLTPITSTYPNPDTIRKDKDTKLQKYLRSINWETTRFTNAQLETMLAASCLRYLGEVGDLDFVIGLCEEIHQKYKTTMKLSLWYSTEILSALADQLNDHTILPTDKATISEFVNDAQEVITKTRYTFEPNF